MRFSLPALIYIVVGVLVAAGIIGDNGNYFTGMDTVEEVVNMVLAVFLWPLVLLGVDFNLGNGGSSGGGGSSPEGGSGGGSGGSGGGSGGSGGGK